MFVFVRKTACLVIMLLAVTFFSALQAWGGGGKDAGSNEHVCKAVRDFIFSHAPWDARQIKIARIHANQQVSLPPGKVSLKVIAPKHTDLLGPVVFQVQLEVDGRLVKTVKVQADIEVWANVLLTAKPLGRGQPLREADIKSESMNLARVPADAVLEPGQVLGMRADRPINAGTVLRSSQFNLPPMVRKGDVIQLVIESDQLKITTRGIAQQDGSRGQNIKVKNMRSDKIIYARVLDHDTAVVNF